MTDWKRQGNYWVNHTTGEKQETRRYPGSKKSYPPDVKTINDIGRYEWKQAVAKRAADKQPVEKFKLTKEQMNYQKSYKQLVKMGKVVRSGIAQNMAKGASLGQMFQEIMGQLQMLKQKAPQDPTFELEGQKPEPTAEQMEMRY